MTKPMATKNGRPFGSRSIDEVFDGLATHELQLTPLAENWTP
jgi:hypothetical protein